MIILLPIAQVYYLEPSRF